MTPRLLVTFGTSVTRGTSHAVLAWTLTTSLVAGSTASSDGVTIAWFASLLMGDRLGGIPVITLSAVVAMAAGCVMAAFEADATAGTSGQFVQLHVEAATTCMTVAIALFAFVGVFGGGSSPRPVEVERLASLAVPSGGVVLTLARQQHHARGPRNVAGVLHGHAAGPMPVALAAPADREVGHRVVLRPRSRLPLAVYVVPLVHHMQPIEYYPNVGRRHPVLQYGGHVEVRCARTTLQRTERNPRAGSDVAS